MFSGGTAYLGKRTLDQNLKKQQTWQQQIQAERSQTVYKLLEGLHRRRPQSRGKELERRFPAVFHKTLLNPAALRRQGQQPGQQYRTSVAAPVECSSVLGMKSLLVTPPEDGSTPLAI